jgi:hypothetical protein
VNPPSLPTDPAAYWTMVGDVVQGIGVLAAVLVTSRSVTRTLREEAKQRRAEQEAEWSRRREEQREEWAQRRREREADLEAEARKTFERRRSMATAGIFEVEDLITLVEDVHGPATDVTHPVLDRILEAADIFPRQTIGEMVTAMKAVAYFSVCRQSETNFAPDASANARAKLLVLLEDLRADEAAGPMRSPRPYIASGGLGGAGSVLAQGHVDATGQPALNTTRA